MKLSELKKVIREEVSKSIKESYEITLAGDTIKGSGDKWPEVVVTTDNDKVTLVQKIGGRTSKVMLSKKQFAQLIKEA